MLTSVPPQLRPDRGPIELIYSEKAASKGAALSREHAIKKLERQ